LHDDVLLDEHSATIALSFFAYSNQVVQPYMTTVGGLTEAKRVVDLALRRGVRVCPGNWSSQVLGAATVHLAAVSPTTPLIEYAPAQIYWSPRCKALRQVGLPVEGGAIAHPTIPGIGVEVPDELNRHFRIDENSDRAG
jgi:L-alanine-DL-glutamate epimerase-like enolase superfamily enzyme